MCCVKPAVQHVSNAVWIDPLFSDNWRLEWAEISAAVLFRGVYLACRAAAVCAHVVRVRGVNPCSLPNTD